jgi:hypothetical protein
MPLSSVLGAQSLVRPGVCTSSTRPASPFEGQTIYETDTDLVKSYDGTTWNTIGPAPAFPAPSTVYGNVLQTVMYKAPITTATTTSTSYVQNAAFDFSLTTVGANSVFLLYGWMRCSTTYNYGLQKLTATTGAGTVDVLECPSAYDRGPFAGNPGGEFMYWSPSYAASTLVEFDWYYRAGYGGAAGATGLAASIGLSVNDTNSNKWSQNVIVVHEIAPSGAITFLP